MNRKQIEGENTYHIRLKGDLHSSIADLMGEVAVLPQDNGETVLVGQFADQAALRGFVDQL